MRFATLLVALAVVIVGLVGIVRPDSLLTMASYVATPVGLYAVAALRVAFGIVLILVAPISRFPRTLRTGGIIVLVAGLATPFFGVERTRAVLAWEAAQGTALVRFVAGLAMAMAGLIAYAVATGRRPNTA
jgi:hypothetical protein